MKKTLLCASLAFGISITPIAHASSPSEQFATTVEIMIDAAVNGFSADTVTRVLDDVIFGPQPDYVTLHEDSLNAIDNLIEDQLVRYVVADMKHAQRNFRDELEYYHFAYGDSGNGDAIDSLVSTGFDVENHTAFRPSSTGGQDLYNEQAYLLTSSYAGVASMLAGILVESRAIHNPQDTVYVQQKASEFADHLSLLGALASNYVWDNVTVYEPPISCDDWVIHSDSSTSDFNSSSRDDIATQGQCAFVVTDSLDGRSASFHVSDYGYYPAQGLASSKRSDWALEHRNTIRSSKFSNIVTKLSNM